MSRRKAKVDFNSNVMNRIIGIQKKRKKQDEDDLGPMGENAPLNNRKVVASPFQARSAQAESQSKDLSSRRGKPEPPKRNGAPKIVKRQKKGRGNFSSFMDVEGDNTRKGGTKRKSPMEKRSRKGRGVFTDLNSRMDDDSGLVGSVDMIDDSTLPPLPKRRKLTDSPEVNKAIRLKRLLKFGNKQKKAAPKKTPPQAKRQLAIINVRQEPSNNVSSNAENEVMDTENDDISAKLLEIEARVDKASKWEKAEVGGEPSSLAFSLSRRKKPDQVLYKPRQKIGKNLDQSYGGDILFEAMTYPEARGICLLMEDELTHFVSTHEEGCILLFPVMNSYHRMLLHKLAERFCLKSFSDGLYEERRARMKHIPGAIVPLIGLRDWVLREERHRCDQQLKRYKDLGRRQITSKFTNAEMDTNDENDLEKYENSVRPIYKWEKISEVEEDAWAKDQHEKVEDIASQKVGIEHIIEVTFNKPQSESEMQDICENLCEEIDSQCEVIIISSDICVVILDTKKMVMKAIQVGHKMGHRIAPFVDAGKEVKRVCGFGIQQRKQRANMSVAHRLLGHALGKRNLTKEVQAQRKTR